MPPFPAEPAKIISWLFLPRSCFKLCSPMTHRTASAILLFPLPLGPIIAVMLFIPSFGGWNSRWVGWAKDLKPLMSRDVRCILYLYGQKYSTLDKEGEVRYTHGLKS